MGAACGFAGAYLTGSTLVGALCGIVAGALHVGDLRAPHARARGQPGRDRPGADHPRPRPFRPDRRRLRRQRIVPAPQLDIPGPDRHPVVGRILFGEDPFVYFSIALVIGVWLVPVPHARRPGAARGRRQPCLGACARLSGAPHPHAAVLFGGACAGLGRRLSVARLYAVLHSRHDRGPRLDRAGAGGVRLVAAGAAGRRRLSVRRGQHPAAARPGLGSASRRSSCRRCPILPPSSFSC